MFSTRLQNLRHRLHRLSHWEYWPQIVTYWFLYPVYGWYALRAKNFFYITLTNPNMENGGLAMESKFKIYQALPAGSYPKTLKVKPVSQNVLAQMKQAGLGFPVVCKPDVGGKGVGVEIVNNQTELYNYTQNSVAAFLVQELVSYPNEAGIFYCRYPNTGKGFISGIVLKKKVMVMGDGKSTLRQLIAKSSRYFTLQKQLFAEFEKQLHTLLPSGEEFILSTIGNHARGSEFVDGTHLVSPELTAVFDQIAKHNDLLYFGRFDVLYESWEGLCKGQNFSIIEVNGCGSEPVHIYDTRYSLFKAWGIISKHWKIAFQIAMQQPGNKKLTRKEGFSLLRKEVELKRAILQPNSKGNSCV